MSTILKTHNLTKIFPPAGFTRYKKRKSEGRHAVDHVNMTIRKGDIYGLIGRNGAGKTTLMRLIAGLMPPTEGTMTLFDSTELEQHRKRTGCIIEAPGLYGNMSAPDNLEAHKRLLGITSSTAVADSLEAVGLSSTDRKKVKHFSLGMRQRLGIAMALLGSPDFLILDEPTNGLDPRGIAEIRAVLTRLSQERGVTVLISSHILGELSKLATCYGIMRGGMLIDDFNRDELETRCQRCLKLVVDQPKKAAMLIETLLDTDNYDILPENTIRLFDYVNQSGLVNRELNQNGILVESITPVGQDIEAYFMSMMGGEDHA